MEKDNHCGYFVERKMRYCRMTVRKGWWFCGEHQPQESLSNNSNVRVKCPFDPWHTCWRSRLTKHLNVCNAKRKVDAMPVFIVEGVNLDNEAIKEPTRMPLSQLHRFVMEAVIKKIHAAYDQLPEFSQTILRHKILEEKLSDENCGCKLRKHLLQNSSLLGHLEQAGLVQDDTCFIEFGAGRAQLTYWLGQIIKEWSNSSILLVDRSNQRHKHDNKLKKQSSLAVRRIRADIADLHLNQITEIQTIKYKVGVAKHLCGMASDLAIRCLVKSMNSEPKLDVRGLVLAFCCYHKCEYSSYVGRKFLEQCGFIADDFPILCSIVSWAICGSRSKSDTDSPPCDLGDPAEITCPPLKPDEREIIGRKARTLLNWGRLLFLESAGFQAMLHYYVPFDVSLENTCIVATRKLSHRD